MSTNVSGNLNAWMVISAVVTAGAAVLNWLAPGRSSDWGHLAAVAGMLLGILVMMKSGEGYVPPEVPDEDDDAAP